jgi:hypothetical protein
MTTTNYDASQLTRKNQARVLGGYANAIAAANNASGGPTTVRTTQPTYQTAVVVTYQNLGKGYCCGLDSPYNSQVAGACGCGTTAGSS